MRLLGTHLHRRLLCVAAVVDVIPDSDRNALAEENPEALLADGFEQAFVGYGYSFGSKPLAIYNEETCLEVLMERDGMTMEQAVDFFYFNVKGAYVGDGTPIFMTPRTEEEG